MTKELVQFIKEDKLIKFYKSSKWLSLRKLALIRDNYECQICKSKGKFHKAENVHHKKEVKTNPSLALDLNNLECLCIRCHNEVHKRLEKYLSRKSYFTNEEKW